MKRKYNRVYEKEEAKSKGVDTALVKRLLTYMRPYRFWLLLAVFLLLVSKGIEAFVPIYIGKLARFILNSTASGEKEKLYALHSVIKGCVINIFLLLFAYLLDSLNVILKNWIGQNALYRLRVDIYRHIQSLPIPFFNKSAVGTLMTRTIHDVEQINQMFSESLVPLLGSAILFICVGAGLIIVDWRAAIVLFCALPIVFLLTNFFRVNQRRCYNKIRAIVAAMNAFVQEHLMGASTIRSFGLEESEKKGFEEINSDHRTANVETIHYFAIFFAGIDFIQNLALISAFPALVLLTGNADTFDAGTYFTFSLYIMMLFRPLGDLAERYNLLQSAIAAAKRIFSVLDEAPEKKEGDSALTIDRIEKIEFRDVWFAYTDENWILKGISFEVKRGESIAVVGMTGAGKTTIMSLLLRFYDYQRGEIKINGIDIRKYPLPMLRKQFSFVLQDPEIFSGTIRENISLGSEEVGPEVVESVIDYVNLRPFINALPNGVDHFLLERGKSISAGERQLISFARAVAHKRSAFILDEATANIDSMTESLVKAVLKKILQDKTAIVIAHRLSTIKDAARIIVLHEGVVAEMGSHQELLKGKGVYEKLYRLQFMG